LKEKSNIKLNQVYTVKFSNLMRSKSKSNRKLGESRQMNIYF